MTMPSIVSRNRALLARKLSIASEKISLKSIVLFALASVLSNVLVWVSGLGTLVVAIGLVHYFMRVANLLFAQRRL
jgi:hypothetical protein